MREPLSRGDAGYTLIELLVAMLLLCFIGIALASGMHFGVRVWESSDKRTRNMAEIASAQSILRELLSSAIPRKKGGFVVFEGEGERVTFEAPPPAAFRASGLAHVVVSLEPGADGTRLLLRVTSLIDKTVTREAVLADHLGGMQFSYLDASEKVPAWLALWRDRKRLPDAVRLETSDFNSETPWPVLIVHPVIAQDALCEFDPISMHCRET
jgi:prepilin-type N-terminal cleavage/methylation domain-containing protein